jgi:hypothetical protein
MEMVGRILVHAGRSGDGSVGFVRRFVEPRERVPSPASDVLVDLRIRLAYDVGGVLD